MNYWLDLFTVQTYDEFQKAGAKVSGFRERQWNRCQRMQPGDKLLCYLDDKFGEDLKAVRSAMQKLAKAYKPSELAHDAYPLYERFRPAIPASKKDWGAKGDLDLGLIGKLAKRKP